MHRRTAPLLASVFFLQACHLWMPAHTEPAGVPPPARDEMSLKSLVHPWSLVHDRYETMSWESFVHEPWRDPLHDEYDKLFGEAFPNPPSRHFATDRPFADVQKYDIAFEASAVRAARAETESGGGEHAVSILLPDSAAKSVSVSADDGHVRLALTRSRPSGRYRSYRPERHIVRLPDGADPASARLVRDGDWVRVKFNRREPGRTHAK